MYNCSFKNDPIISSFNVFVNIKRIDLIGQIHKGSYFPLSLYPFLKAAPSFITFSFFLQKHNFYLLYNHLFNAPLTIMFKKKKIKTVSQRFGQVLKAITQSRWFLSCAIMIFYSSVNGVTSIQNFSWMKFMSHN